jgi:hypothetical protein
MSILQVVTKPNVDCTVTLGLPTKNAKLFCLAFTFNVVDIEKRSLIIT